jgi:hypothetical protein
MANISRSLSSFFVIVGFLVLTALASILYGGNTTQQEKMKQNIFWQGGRYVADTLLGAVAGVGNIGQNKNLAASQTIKDEAAQADLNNVSFSNLSNNLTNDNGTGANFWSNFKARLAQEWPDSQTTAETTAGAWPLKWQKTATGAEIIFTSKSGQEHKLSLPFKFLSR